MRYLDWRKWLRTLTGLWRSSLQLRTVAITVILSSIAVWIIGGYMSYSVGAKLFDARLAQAGEASSKATIAAQDRFDASEESDSLDSEAAMQLALEAASQTASTPGANTQIAILRSKGQPFAASPIDRVTGGLVASTIPDELREAVANSVE